MIGAGASPEWTTTCVVGSDHAKNRIRALMHRFLSLPVTFRAGNSKISIVNALNALIAWLIGMVLVPLSSAPLIGLVVFGLLSGALAAIVFRYTSSQKAIKRVADQTRASLLAMRLFSDDPRNTLKAQFSLLWYSVKRLLLSLPPMLVMAPLFLVLLSHMAMWYEFRPLAPLASTHGEFALLEARFSESSWTKAESAKIAVPEGLSVTARVRDATARTVTWRLSPIRAAGSGTIRLEIPDAAPIEKQVVVDNTRHLRFVSPMRPAGSGFERFFYPGEPAFDAASPIQSIAITYDHRTTPVFGFNVPWWLTFFVVSIVGALLAKPFGGVQF